MLWCTIMSLLVNKKQVSYYTYYCHYMEGERHHVACVCVCVCVCWLNENPNLQKKSRNFIFKIGKKSTKFHWEWSRISAPENTKKSLSPLEAWAAVRSKAVVLLLLVHCRSLCGGFVFGPCFVMKYLVFFLVSQSSGWRRESWAGGYKLFCAHLSN